MSPFVSKEKRNLLPLHIDSSCMITTCLFKALFLRRPRWSRGRSDCQGAGESGVGTSNWLENWLHGLGNPSLALHNVFLFTPRHCGGAEVELPNLWREHADILRDQREVSKICRHKIYICVGKLAICSSPIMWFPW